MTIGVVDLLEVIDIEQQEGQRRVFPPCHFERFLSAVEEVPAVAALGQDIRGCQQLQLAFDAFLFSDVFGHADHDQPMLVVGLLVDKTLVAEPADVAVGIDDAVLAVFHGAFDQHFGQAALGVVEVIGVDAVAPLIAVGQ
ncbi:hypothetical protein D3C72_2000220 [compost metagenome]